MIRILKSILASIPDISLALLFLITWIDPHRLPYVTVDSMVLIVLLEFIVIHSAGFMGAILVGDSKRSKKLVATAGFGVFYLLFFIVFAVVFRTWWPMLAFLLLMGNRLFSIVLHDHLTMTQKSMIMTEWALALTFYLLCVFASVIVPIEPMGVTSVLSTGGSGEWELRPYKALFAGVVYYALMGMTKFFLVMKANRGIR